jgi:O-antigen ligase
MILGHRAVHISKKIVVIGSALILIPVMSITTYTLIPESLFKAEIITTDVANTDTIAWRFKRWNVALAEGTKSPIFGIGLSNLRDILGEKLGNANNAHNSYITLFTELGLVGFIPFVAIMVSLIRLGLRLCHRGRLPRDRLRGAAFVAILVAYLMPGFFANTLLGTLDFSTLYMFVLLGGIARVYNPPLLGRTSSRMARMGRQGKPPMYASS